MKPPIYLVITAIVVAIFSFENSHAQAVLSDAFDNQAAEDTSEGSIPASFSGFWRAGATEGVARTIETGNRLVLAVDGGGAPETAQTASLRTTDVYSDLNFFRQKLEIVLKDVDLSAKETGGNVINGVFQFGLAPVPSDSVNTGRPNLLYFRIRPGTREVSLTVIEDGVPRELATETWSGPLTSLRIALTLDNEDFDLSITSDDGTFTTGSTKHDLSQGIWDTSQGFGMWTQSFGGAQGQGPGVTASIDSLEITANPEG